MAFSDSLGNDVKIREKMIGRSVDQYAVEGQALAVGGEEVHQSYPQYDQEYHVSCVTTRSTIYIIDIMSYIERDLQESLTLPANPPANPLPSTFLPAD